MDEQPLTGGNVSAGVVRVGDTVRRPAGAWTPAVHALLTHLHDVGFAAAPRPLGIDDQGREVLTFAPGEAAWPHRFAVFEPAEQLSRVARLVREYHDAVATFTPPADARWQSLMPAPGPESGEIIAHHDLAPWNLVVDDGSDRWTFIDWDGAAPGTRLWDMTYTIKAFVPLTAAPALRRSDRKAGIRLRLMADAYGLDEAQRRALAPQLAQRTRAMYDFLRDQTERGIEPWARLWAEGHGDAWLADARYIEAREALWLAALVR